MEWRKEVCRALLAVCSGFHVPIFGQRETSKNTSILVTRETLTHLEQCVIVVGNLTTMRRATL
jgi:hypothetical protein